MTGRDAGGERGLREAFEDDLAREVIVGVVFKGEEDIGEPVERDRAHHDHVGHAVHLEFERKGDEALDFFGGVTGPLGDDFDLRGREVGIGVHRHALEREDPADGDESGEHQDQEPLPQSRLDDSMNHSVVVATILTSDSETLA